MYVFDGKKLNFHFWNSLFSGIALILWSDPRALSLAPPFHRLSAVSWHCNNAHCMTSRIPLWLWLCKWHFAAESQTCPTRSSHSHRDTYKNASSASLRFCCRTFSVFLHLFQSPDEKTGQQCHLRAYFILRQKMWKLGPVGRRKLNFPWSVVCLSFTKKRHAQLFKCPFLTPLPCSWMLGDEGEQQLHAHSAAQLFQKRPSCHIWNTHKWCSRPTMHEFIMSVARR